MTRLLELRAGVLCEGRFGASRSAKEVEGFIRKQLAEQGRDRR